MRVCHLGLHQPFVSFFVSTNETSTDKQVFELLCDCRADFQSTIKKIFLLHLQLVMGSRHFVGNVGVTCTISSEVLVTCSWSIDLYLNLSFFSPHRKRMFQRRKGRKYPSFWKPMAC